LSFADEYGPPGSGKKSIIKELTVSQTSYFINPKDLPSPAKPSGEPKEDEPLPESEGDVEPELGEEGERWEDIPEEGEEGVLDKSSSLPLSPKDTHFLKIASLRSWPVEWPEDLPEPWMEALYIRMQEGAAGAGESIAVEPPGTQKLPGPGFKKKRRALTRPGVGRAGLRQEVGFLTKKYKRHRIFRERAEVLKKQTELDDKELELLQKLTGLTYVKPKERGGAQWDQVKADPKVSAELIKFYGEIIKREQEQRDPPPPKEEIAKILEQSASAAEKQFKVMSSNPEQAKQEIKSKTLSNYNSKQRLPLMEARVKRAEVNESAFKPALLEVFYRYAHWSTLPAAEIGAPENVEEQLKRLGKVRSIIDQEAEIDNQLESARAPLEQQADKITQAEEALVQFLKQIGQTEEADESALAQAEVFSGQIQGLDDLFRDYLKSHVDDRSEAKITEFQDEIAKLENQRKDVLDGKISEKAQKSIDSLSATLENESGRFKNLLKEKKINDLYKQLEKLQDQRMKLMTPGEETLPTREEIDESDAEKKKREEKEETKKKLDEEVQRGWEANVNKALEEWKKEQEEKKGPEAEVPSAHKVYKALEEEKEKSEEPEPVEEPEPSEEKEEKEEE